MNLKKIYTKRNDWQHKGDFGYILIVAGGRIYSGSPIFNAMAALRSGADLTTIICRERTANIAASFSPDIIARPLDNDLLPKHINKIVSLSKKFNSLIIGGGLAREPKTYKAIGEIIKKVNLPMVIDAEAIRAVTQNKDILKGKQIILTPHIEEFKILSGENVNPDEKDRKEKTEKLAKNLGATILLKGHIDIISNGEKTTINKTGSPYMTKGGFGDTLAGICGTLLARGVEPFEAAETAAYINGKAGELATKEYGEGVLASDIFKFIPKVINR